MFIKVKGDTDASILDGVKIVPKQVGNPTSTTSHLKRRETKDAQGSAHFFLFINGF
jgi:hypothetical protein